MTDHYTTLGVDRNANPDEIKAAYRRMAAKHHPDRGGDTAAFQNIQSAYETLTDPDKKAQYDNPHPQFHQQPGGFHFHSGNFDDIFAQFTGGHPFEAFFGNRHPPHRNATITVQTSITLEEAFYGKELVANVSMPSGRDQTINVKIPAGIQDGTTLRLAGLGDDRITNAARGDLHLTVSILPHAVFQRHGDDLHRDLEIDCIDAMLGKTINIQTINGRTLEINVTPGIQHGQTLCVSGHGMPKMGDDRFHGHMMLNIKINIPKILNDQQKSLLQQFKNL
jgi:curved DNA-binding protein